MSQLAIEQLFQRYVAAFHQQNMADIQRCYQLPCTLHTPDRVVLIDSAKAFAGEFIDIFTVLNHANIVRFIALKASFSHLNDKLILACVDWQFIDANEQVFTDFSAFYHLAMEDGQWRIFNVVSQELSRSIELNTPLNIFYNIPCNISE